MIPPSPIRSHGRPSTRASNCPRERVAVASPPARRSAPGGAGGPPARCQCRHAPGPSSGWRERWRRGRHGAGALRQRPEQSGPAPCRCQPACPGGAWKATQRPLASPQPISQPGTAFAGGLERPLNLDGAATPAHFNANAGGRRHRGRRDADRHKFGRSRSGWCSLLPHHRHPPAGRLHAALRHPFPDQIRIQTIGESHPRHRRSRLATGSNHRLPEFFAVLPLLAARFRYLHDGVHYR